MADRDFLQWPFLDAAHRDFAARVEAFAAGLPAHHGDADAATQGIARALGEAGLLEAAVPPDGRLEVRKLCLARDMLARHSGLADFAFAMQGLGTGAITLFGSEALKARVLPGVRAGTTLAAFALSEPEAGSDVAAMATTAQRDGEGWVLNGEKTWISNGGIAGSYVVFARSGEAPGAKGLSCFWVPGEAMRVVERIETAAPHPLARLALDAVRVPDTHRIGAPGEGFKVAMAVLDVFRATVGAAALGFARRGLDLLLERAATRRLFGAPLFDQGQVQAAVADAAMAVDASALLVYRAAWVKDQGTPRVSREASMAKLHATEAAFRVADAAAQFHGGMGVVSGSPAELLTREVRALRVYEGASEIQRVVIARAERDRRAG